MRSLQKTMMLSLLMVALVGASALAYSSYEIDNPQLLQHLGFFAYQQGDVSLAEKLFRSATTTDPSYEHAKLDLAIILHERGDYQGAADELRTLTVLDEGNVMYWYDLGVNLIAQFKKTGEVDLFLEGVTAYERAAQIDERYAFVQENLVVLYRVREELGI